MLDFKDVKTVDLNENNDTLVILDQTLLPNRVEVKSIERIEDVYEAIYSLRVRGAPAIGVAAAIGLYAAATRLGQRDCASFCSEVMKAADYLEKARPTAVNLSWAIARMKRTVLGLKGRPVVEVTAAMRSEALKIRDEDVGVCRAIGERGLGLLKPGMGLLTHCNAGRLAAVEYGTATAPIYLGCERGYGFRVFCDETRPLLQGARLTAFELMAAGVDTTLICDGMAPSVMKKGWIDAVLVGCDRVAANGDAANKIGTSYVALAARKYKVPFYVCAPTSTIDLSCQTGDDIVIEQRPAAEITELWYKERMAPEGVKVFNPGFDVTEADYITAIITERGVAYPPFKRSIAGLFTDEGGSGL